MAAGNVELVWELFAAFNVGDLERAAALAHPELVYHFPGRSPLAGEHHGVDGYAAVLETAKRLTGGTIRLDPVAVSADGDHVVVWGRLTARRGERVYDGWNAYVYRFTDGRMSEGRTIPADLYAFDAFWD
jgi:ketosteroid isomerase-like protein